MRYRLDLSSCLSITEFSFPVEFERINNLIKESNFWKKDVYDMFDKPNYYHSGDTYYDLVFTDLDGGHNTKFFIYCDIKYWLLAVFKFHTKIMLDKIIIPVLSNIIFKYL